MPNLYFGVLKRVKNGLKMAKKHIEIGKLGIPSVLIGVKFPPVSNPDIHLKTINLIIAILQSRKQSIYITLAWQTLHDISDSLCRTW